MLDSPSAARTRDEEGLGSMASKLRLKGMNAVHRLVIKTSGGRLGWQGGGMPVLELTTIGRKSGDQRVTMLSSPLQDGDTIVVVALGEGGVRHPAWYLNLSANPRVTVKWQGAPPQAMRAHTANEPDRDRMWPLIIESFPDFAKWQAEAGRQLPLVVLEPIA
ncbi:MAG: nitroreductase/quinone reductase family protein [Acidimicrobiia bacterium]